VNVEQTFKNVVGREMSPDEVTRYLKLQKEFEIPDTDAIWMMFIWFEFYQRIFEQFPASARAECEAVTRQVKEASAGVIRASAAEIEKSQAAAKTEIDTMTARTKQEIAKALGQSMTGAVDKAIAQITESVAVQAAKAQAMKWLSIGGGVILLAILLTGGGAWYYFSTQINQVRAVDAAKLRAVEEAPPTTLSLNCNAPGEEVQVGSDGRRWCTRLLPPQSGRGE
jgi:hypothetical protein